MKTTKLVVDNGFIYYRYDSQIVRMKTDGKERLVLANASQEMFGDCGLTVDATDVYFADDKNFISRVAK